MSNPFLQAAKDLIYPNGVSITFTRVIEGEYNTSTGTVTNTEVNTTVKAFPKNVKVNAYNYPNLTSKEVKEYLIVASDLANKPQPQDKVTQGSTVYSVDSVREHVAQGQIVLYRVIVYKG